MARKRKAVAVVSVIQVVVGLVWLWLVYRNSNPHTGTVVNLAAMIAVGLGGLVTQATGEFKRAVVVVNWALAGLWSYGLYASMSRMTQASTSQWIKDTTFLLTLAIIIPCVINGVLVALLPRRSL